MMRFKPQLTGILCCLSFLTFAQTNDALWLRFPNISPDGSTIAFAYMGDIYTVPRTGGLARQLTLHESYESDPIWSPDGQHLAFASYRHGNSDIFIIPATGGSPTRLTFHSAGDVPECFSPDGKEVIFSSSRLDAASAVLYPSGVLPELYTIGISGNSRARQLLTTPAIDATYSKSGDVIAFHDQKGYEDDLRKHHTSSVARDLWTYKTSDGTFNQVTTWEGEDRTPRFYAENKIYFLSERSGSFNVWKTDIASGKESGTQQVSFLEKHPVRDLSVAANGMICFNYNGEIYTQLPPAAPQKIAVQVQSDRRYNANQIELISGNCSEFLLSPNEKEIAFIVRGEVYVTSIEFNDTKRITNTPEMERNLAFNSDGTKLMYAGERNNSWNIYEASLERKDEKYFYNSTLISEKALVETAAETFQPSYSPDDKEIAFLENRTTLRVKNLVSGDVRTVLPGSYNYSYSDGDQYYIWSPDSKWLLVNYIDQNRWSASVGLVKATGEELPINISNSGYDNSRPKFDSKGEIIYWASDREGFRSHGSWGSQSDIYGVFLTVEAYKKFSLNKSDYAFWKEQQEEKKKEEEKTKEESDDKKDKQDEKKDEKKTVEPIKIDWEGIDDRKKKMTIFSSFLGDYLLGKDAETIYYLTSTGEGMNLWQTKFREQETKLLAELKGDYSSIQIDKEFSNLYLVNSGQIQKIKLEDGSVKPVVFSSEMNLNTDAERRYMFEHAWRQFREKFYLTDIHGIDWQFYHDNYEKFLPHINNKNDFADMLSEMLGEANASHTGAFAYVDYPTGDRTASLGIFVDQDYTGDGIKILELMPNSPLSNAEKRVSAGVIIDKIDGEPIKANTNYWPLLNRKAHKKILISYRDSKTGKTWDEVVEPISAHEENQLLYRRWVERCEAETKRLSDGKIGYVHVKGMNSASFREVYSKALGKYNNCDALLVDTRFNGGGWLHDDLATFLDGKPYMQFVPRGQENMGGEPLSKWQKPSAVLMSESNYSDAHMFPYTYKFFNIGKLIGMPVPGTGTAVWWEAMIDGTVFGIPQIGMRDTKTGQLLENLQLEPDIKVMNEPGKVRIGEDQQLKAGVQHLLEITSK